MTWFVNVGERGWEPGLQEFGWCLSMEKPCRGTLTSSPPLASFKPNGTGETVHPHFLVPPTGVSVKVWFYGAPNRDSQ